MTFRGGAFLFTWIGGGEGGRERPARGSMSSSRAKSSGSADMSGLCAFILIVIFIVIFIVKGNACKYSSGGKKQYKKNFFLNYIYTYPPTGTDSKTTTAIITTTQKGKKD